MASSSRQGLRSAFQGVSKALNRGQWQSLEQQFQSLRLGPSICSGRRNLSTESGAGEQQELSITAASEIQFKELAKKYRIAQHARAVPVSPSYFSRTPTFNDRYLTLEKLAKAYANLPVIPAADVERVAWKTLADLRQSFGEPIKATEYVKCLAIVKRLHQIHPDLKPEAVKAALQDFKRDVQGFQNVPRPIPIDRFGRALGVGKRKSSTARAFVVEGNGEILVNGRTLAEYFGRVHDRESAVWALHATDRIDKYNVWARVEGGGTTGQAEALTLAIAKALLAHEPALKPALRRGERTINLGRHCMLVGFANLFVSSRMCHPRPEKSGEEEARPCQGKEASYMGQEMIVGWLVCHDGELWFRMGKRCLFGNEARVYVGPLDAITCNSLYHG